MIVSTNEKSVRITRAERYKIFVSSDKVWHAYRTLSQVRGGSTSADLAVSILILAFLEKQLLQRVKAVTEDEIYLTIEFNEFLKMMSEESKEDLKIENLIEAFKYIHWV